MEFCHGGFITDTNYIHTNNISIDDVGACILFLFFLQTSMLILPDNTDIQVNVHTASC